MGKLRSLEGPGFELVDATVWTEGGQQDAQLFRWRGLPDKHSYFEAARRKVAIAEHELPSLERRLSDSQGLPIEAPVGIQADFEGVLYAFDAEVDQLTQALGVRRRSRLERLPPQGPRVEYVATWLHEPVVEEMTYIRNDATHA
jgi:hypothetical protein